MGIEPLLSLFEIARQDDLAKNELAGNRRNNLYL